LKTELRSLAPIDCEVHVYESSNPITEPFKSGIGFALHPSFARRVVTRAEYLEGGSNACRRKFASESNNSEVEEESVKEKEKPKGKGKARVKNINLENEGMKKSGRGTRARTSTK